MLYVFDCAVTQLACNKRYIACLVMLIRYAPFSTPRYSAAAAHYHMPVLHTIRTVHLHVRTLYVITMPFFVIKLIIRNCATFARPTTTFVYRLAAVNASSYPFEDTYITLLTSCPNVLSQEHKCTMTSSPAPAITRTHCRISAVPRRRFCNLSAWTAQVECACKQTPQLIAHAL